MMFCEIWLKDAHFNLSKRFFLLFVIFLSLEASLCYAKQLKSEDIRKIQEKIKAFSDLQVEFNQKTYRALRKRTSKSNGRAFFSKPNKFRWILEEPKRDEWIFDGKELNHFFPARKEAISYSANINKGKDFRQIVDLVLNFDTLLKKYDIKSAEQIGEIVKIHLIPKNKGEILSADLSLDLKKNYISQLQLNFKQGNHTKLEFLNPVKKSIPASTFSVPAGIKKIKAT